MIPWRQVVLENPEIGHAPSYGMAPGSFHRVPLDQRARGEPLPGDAASAPELYHPDSNPNWIPDFHAHNLPAYKRKLQGDLRVIEDSIWRAEKDPRTHKTWWGGTKKARFSREYYDAEMKYLVGKRMELRACLEKVAYQEKVMEKAQQGGEDAATAGPSRGTGKRKKKTKS